LSGLGLQLLAQAAMVSRRHQNSYRSPRLRAEVSGSPHKSASSSSTSTTSRPPASISNHNTKLLESRLSHRKQSPRQFLIDNFQRLLDLAPRNPHQKSTSSGQFRAGTGARKSENRVTRARKLENRASYVLSAASKFLIDNFYQYFRSFVPRIFRKRLPQPELHRASKVTSIVISKRQEDS